MASLHVWIAALRPKTLPAGIVPVALGSALAKIDGNFNWTTCIATLCCSVLMQIASNFFNEIYDFRRGADTDARTGPTRAVASGLLSEQKMKIAAIATIFFAFSIGLYLTLASGWPVFAIGIISLAASWAYTGGKHPLAYIGLGEIMAFIFYGIIAVCGTYYIQTGTITFPAFLLSLAPAAFAANILAVNNIRDEETDRLAGKNTIAVRFGSHFLRRIYALLMIIPFTSTFLLAMSGYSLNILWSLIAIIPTFFLVSGVFRMVGKQLNLMLSGTGILLIFYAVLLIFGLFF